jgi:hypothetical protein
VEAVKTRRSFRLLHLLVWLSGRLGLYVQWWSAAAWVICQRGVVHCCFHPEPLPLPLSLAIALHSFRVQLQSLAVVWLR